MSKCKITLLTVYPNLLSYEAFSGNKIYEMKVCLNIDGVFKLFEIVVLANFHDKMSVMTLCVIYFNIMGFMQNKLKELQLLAFLENS